MSNNPYNIPSDDDNEGITAPSAPAPIIDDRGEPQTKSPKKRKKFVFLAAAFVVIGTLAVLAFVANFVISATKKEVVDPTTTDAATELKRSAAPSLGAFQEKVREQMDKDKTNAELAELAKRDAEAKRIAALNASTEKPTLGNYGAPRAEDGTNPAPTAGDGKPAPLTPAQAAAQRRFQDEVLWGEKSDQGGRASPGEQGGNGQALSSRPNTTIGDSLKTESFAAGSAYRRASRKFLLIHGTTIPCVLIPRIVTNYPGNVSCLISRDVYSADGSVLLINRGATAFGERKLALAQGVEKVFVSWGTIENTDGVSIRIDSLAADSLGSAGLDAWIDNHYPQRFGGAILLSALDDLFAAVGQKLSDSTVQVDNSTNNASDMASKALDASINIPPTGYVLQANETNILVVRDIDFTQIYGTE